MKLNLLCKFLAGVFCLVFSSFSYGRDLQTSNLPENDYLSESESKLTQTVLWSTPSNASFYSQPLTFVVNVVPIRLPAATPTGTVQFKINHVEVANQPLVKGIAKFTTSSIPSSSLEQFITAVYSGDDHYSTSADSLYLSIFQANTSINLTSSPSPSSWGQPVTFNAIVNTVPPAKATPEGIVQFIIDGIMASSTNLDSNGRAIFSTAAIPAGNHNVTAIYVDHENFNGASINKIQQVDKADTTMSLVSSTNPSTFGKGVNYVVTVVSENATPTGTVQFIIDGRNFGVPITLNESHKASITVPDLPAGIHRIFAYFLENENFSPSNASLRQQINKANTNVTLASSANPSTFGAPMTFTARATSEGALLAGKIQFTMDGKNLSTPIKLDDSGQASLTLPNLTGGSHKIEANYLGNMNFNPSTELLTQQINKAHTSITVASSKNPSTFGEPVNFAAAVTSEGLALAGKIQFKIDGINFGSPISLDSSGQTPLITIPQMTVGIHKIEGNYLGNESFNPSDFSLNQQVDKADTNTLVTSSANPSTFGQAVTYTATVSATKGLPTGTVQFKMDGENVGNSKILNDRDQASITIDHAKVGNHTMTALYSGDADFNESTSPDFIVSVNAPEKASETGDHRVVPKENEKVNEETKEK